MVPGYDYIGEFVAFNPVTGQRAWEYHPESGAAMTASALAAAGGIVFGGTADRRFVALAADNGDVLWETRLNGDTSGVPVTFEIDGRQYLYGRRPRPHRPDHFLCAADRYHVAAGKRYDVGVCPALRVPSSQTGHY